MHFVHGELKNVEELALAGLQGWQSVGSSMPADVAARCTCTLQAKLMPPSIKHTKLMLFIVPQSRGTGSSAQAPVWCACWLAHVWAPCATYVAPPLATTVFWLG